MPYNFLQAKVTDHNIIGKSAYKNVPSYFYQHCELKCIKNFIVEKGIIKSPVKYARLKAVKSFLFNELKINLHYL